MSLLNTHRPSRVAIVSHVLPCAQSGQGIVLQRVLGGLDADAYRVISPARPAADGNSGQPRPFVRLGPLPRFPYFWELPVLSWLFHLVNALLLVPLRAVQLVRVLRREGCDALVACSGNLHLIPAAALASRWTGTPLTLYMFDDFILQWPGFQRVVATLLEKFSMRWVDSVIVPNEFMEQTYRGRYALPVRIVRNPCAVSDYTFPPSGKRPALQNEVRIVFTGSIYHAHYDAFRNLVLALERLGDRATSLHIYTAQPVDKLLRQRIGGHFVEFHPHVDPAQVPGVIQQADILFLPLAFQSTIAAVIRTSSPGKMGEYLASGVPVLVHAPQDAFVSWFFRQNGCGFVVDRPDIDLLAATIKSILCNRVRVAECVKRARVCSERDFTIESVQRAFCLAIGRDAA